MLASFVDKLVSQDGQLLQYFATVLLPLVAVKYLPLPAPLQPLRWLGELAKSLAAKVLHTERASSQQALAGVLSLLLLVLPFWVISSLLLYLAEYPWFFEMLLLYLCLQDLHILRAAGDITTALQNGDKSSARSLLSDWVARDTAELSETGIAKATIEALVTVPGYRLLASLTTYLLFGAPVTLLFAMLWQLQQIWWPQNPRYHYFSRALSWSNQLLFWVPLLLWRFSLSLSGGINWLFTTHKISHHQDLRSYQQLCAMVAAMLHIELGGPQKYNGVKVSSSKLSYGNLPTVTDIHRATVLVKAAIAFWIILLTAIPVIWIGLRWFHTH